MSRKRQKSKAPVLGEPTISKENVDAEIATALTWYNYNKTPEDAKNYFLQYLQQSSHSTETAILTTTNITIPNNIGWLCRMCLVQPNALPQKYIDKIEEVKQQVLLVQTSPPISPPTKLRPTVQENINNQFKEILGEIEEIIDKFVAAKGEYSFRLYEWLKDKDIKPIQAKHLASHFESGLLLELQIAHTKACPQLVEAYSFLTEPQLQTYIKFVKQLIEDAIIWEKDSRTKANLHRAPRKKKIKPPKQLTKHLKYLNEHNGIKSVDPTDIIGANQLWAYNTKTRLLVCYTCTNPHGLSVKGTTIINFDSNTSCGKLLRKPEQILTKVIELTKGSLKNLFDGLTTRPKKLTGRINNDYILLRTI